MTSAQNPSLSEPEQDRAPQAAVRPADRSSPLPAQSQPYDAVIMMAMSRANSSFVPKLYEIVKDPQLDHLISWNAGGDAIIVHDPEALSRQVLPIYFKHSNWNSFVRQLNMYGWKKRSDMPKPAFPLLATADASAADTAGAASASVSASTSANTANTANTANSTSGSHPWTFYHDLFQRDKPDLMLSIRRRGPKMNHSEQTSSAGGVNGADTLTESCGSGGSDNGDAPSSDECHGNPAKRPRIMDSADSTTSLTAAEATAATTATAEISPPVASSAAAPYSSSSSALSAVSSHDVGLILERLAAMERQQNALVVDNHRIQAELHRAHMVISELSAKVAQLSSHQQPPPATPAQHPFAATQFAFGSHSPPYSRSSNSPDMSDGTQPSAAYPPPSTQPSLHVQSAWNAPGVAGALYNPQPPSNSTPRRTVLPLPAPKYQRA